MAANERGRQRRCERSSRSKPYVGAMALVKKKKGRVGYFASWLHLFARLEAASVCVEKRGWRKRASWVGGIWGKGLHIFAPLWIVSPKVGAPQKRLLAYRWFLQAESLVCRRSS